MAGQLGVYSAMLSSVLSSEAPISAFAHHIDTINQLEVACIDRVDQLRLLQAIANLPALLGRTVALGLQQLPQVLGLPNDVTKQRAFHAIGMICLTLAKFGGTLAKERFAAMVQTPGLLPAFAAASSIVADTLQQEQEQEQQQDAAAAAAFTCSLLSFTMALSELFRSMAQCAGWDSMLSSPIAPAVQPVVRLLLQHLRATSRNGLSYEDMHHNKVLGPAHLLSELFLQDLGAALYVQQQESSLLPLLESGEALQLVLAHTACVAAVMHSSRSAKSPASAAGALRSRGFGRQLHQQLQVPPSHCDLFDAVGMDRAFRPELLAMHLDSEDNRDKAFVDCLLAIKTATELPYKAWASQQQQPIERTLAAARRQAVTAAAVHHAIPPHVVQPLLHVILELQLLQPKVQHAGFGMHIMQHLLHMQLAVNPDRAEEMYTSLAQPLLHLLGPAALYACRELDDMQQHVLANSFGPLLLLVPDSGPSVERYVEAFKQQPLLCSAVQEAAMRVKANAPSAVRLPSDPKRWLSAARFAVTLCEETLGSSAETASSSSTAAAAAAAGADHVRQVLLQQFALVLSALKHGAAASAAQPSFRLQILDLAVHAAQVGKKAATAAAAAAAGVATPAAALGAGREAPGSQMQLQQAWLTLIARSLLLVSSVLAESGEPSIVYEMPYALVDLLPRYTARQLLTSCLDSTEVLQLQLQQLGLPGDAAADGEVLVLCQLLQQLSELRVSLQQAATKALETFEGHSQQQQQQQQQVLDEGFASELEVMRKMYTPEILQQLRDVCSMVCVQLPHKHCCNYQGCTNMATLSELQLANGKQSICSNCKKARYCSKECQRAAWKQHKHVCKRLAVSG